MAGILDYIGGALLGRFGRTQPRACADGLVYAVGDVHGRVDLLVPLMAKILDDALNERGAMSDGPAPVVVFLGDMIDRGPDSKGTLEFLAAIREWPEITPVMLYGNHEAMLLDFLATPEENGRWVRFGGYETLLSYGLSRVGDLSVNRDLRRLAEDLNGAMGPHVALLRSCIDWHLSGNIAFVHAGADPDVPLGAQEPAVLIWGSEKFARRRRADGLWVVHGHTIVERPVVRGGRISLDTGAYLTGVLTALKVKGEEISFLNETGAPG